MNLIIFQNENTSHLSLQEKEIFSINNEKDTYTKPPKAVVDVYNKLFKTTFDVELFPEDQKKGNFRSNLNETYTYFVNLYEIKYLGRIRAHFLGMVRSNKVCIKSVFLDRLGLSCSKLRFLICTLAQKKIISVVKSLPRKSGGKFEIEVNEDFVKNFLEMRKNNPRPYTKKVKKLASYRSIMEEPMDLIKPKPLSAQSDPKRVPREEVAGGVDTFPTSRSTKSKSRTIGFSTPERSTPKTESKPVSKKPVKVDYEATLDLGDLTSTKEEKPSSVPAKDVKKETPQPTSTKPVSEGSILRPDLMKRVPENCTYDDVTETEVFGKDGIEGKPWLDVINILNREIIEHQDIIARKKAARSRNIDYVQGKLDRRLEMKFIFVQDLKKSGLLEGELEHQQTQPPSDLKTLAEEMDQLAI